MKKIYHLVNLKTKVNFKKKKKILFKIFLLFEDNNNLYNDYCLVNAEPYIKSKYRLVANILYILHFELIYLNKRIDLIPSQTKNKNIPSASEHE